MGWGTQPQRAAAAGTLPREQEYRIPLVEEELDVSRHRQQVGEIVIGKEVIEEQRTIDVPVAHEEVTIERHYVNRPTDQPMPPVGREDQEVRVPIYEDQVDVQKHARVREEIVVTPEEVTGQQHVTDRIRREVPRVNTKGDVDNFVHGEEELEDRNARDREIRDENARKGDVNP
jgi:uncharacterized protein (TIGR02271 family)